MDNAHYQRCSKVMDEAKILDIDLLSSTPLFAQFKFG